MLKNIFAVIGLTTLVVTFFWWIVGILLDRKLTDQEIHEENHHRLHF